MNSIFMNQLIRKVLCYHKIYKFKHRNGIKNLPPRFFVRSPEFIKVCPDAAFGENCKLLCIEKYNGEDLHPSLRIGNNFHATSNLRIQCANNIQIGNNVLIASDVFIIDYNHGFSPETPSYLDNNLELNKENGIGGVIIEDGVWIGNAVTILPFVRIGKKTIIGAGSVVCHDIPDYSIAVGNPAKVIKKYNFVTKKWEKI